MGSGFFSNCQGFFLQDESINFSDDLVADGELLVELVESRPRHPAAPRRVYTCDYEQLF